MLICLPLLHLGRRLGCAGYIEARDNLLCLTVTGRDLLAGAVAAGRMVHEQLEVLRQLLGALARIPEYDPGGSQGREPERISA